MNGLKKTLVGIVLGMGLLNPSISKATPENGIPMTNVAITVTQNCTLTWNFIKQYQIIATNYDGKGSVNSTDVDPWKDEGTTNQYTAVPDAYSAFLKWEGAPSGKEYDNPISIQASNPLTLVAKFSDLTTTNGTPKRWLHDHGVNEDDDTIDSDNDRCKNWEEYIADTDPTNSNKYFHVSEIKGNPPRLVIPDSSTGRIYSVEYATNLLNGFDCIETNDVAGNGSDLEIEVNNDKPNKYYRPSVGLPK